MTPKIDHGREKVDIYRRPPSYPLAKRQNISNDEGTAIQITTMSYFHDPEDRTRTKEGRTFFSGITPPLAVPCPIFSRNDRTDHVKWDGMV
ncbi:hypothetical protein E2N92_06680 [Methanofollis formosanus]|uniref:Uncharacterized protein n=1 Tax=Methanofollis formosanus TaxID=299308 RepID=A0A8G1A2Z9_9EURY|nr:hypothetical protein E2N92_06680 [Methanofollis formosanus]